MQKILCFLLCLVSLGSYTQVNITGEDNLFLVVGSYSNGTTSGISVYDFNIQTGDYLFISDLKEIVNPSYLAVSQDEKMIYSVNETREGEVSAFRFDKSKGVLSFVNTQPAKGANPCYISIDKGQNFIVTANYSGGNVSVFPLDADGSIKPLSMNINLNTPDSLNSNMHTVVFSPDEKQLFATDLGKHNIYSFGVRPNAKEIFLDINLANTTKLESGSGPRHLAFHPNGKYLYCINEISGKVTALTYEDGKLEAFQYIASDTTQTVRKSSADIHLTSDGRFLYSSNRNRPEGIAIFSVNPENGQLTRIGYQPTGAHPRNFTITPNNKFLLCANRNTNNIQIFAIDPITGLLSDTGKEIQLRQPVCLKWLSK